MAEYYIYILTNASGMLYVGLTTDIEPMLEKHRNQLVQSFKANFSFNKLIFLERLENPNDAISRFNFINSLSRIKKRELVKQNSVQEVSKLELKIRKSA